MKKNEQKEVGGLYIVEVKHCTSLPELERSSAFCTSLHTFLFPCANHAVISGINRDVLYNFKAM
nr:hypothetical protein PJ912_25090 [Pectobacterium colocasium]